MSAICPLLIVVNRHLTNRSNVLSVRWGDTQRKLYLRSPSFPSSAQMWNAWPEIVTMRLIPRNLLTYNLPLGLRSIPGSGCHRGRRFLEGRQRWDSPGREGRGCWQRGHQDLRHLARRQRRELWGIWWYRAWWGDTDWWWEMDGLYGCECICCSYSSGLYLG